VLPQSLSRAAPPPALASLEALLLHGTADDVMSVERGREARDLLRPLLGDRLAYREYPIGHGISEESLAEAATWLAARAG
jgi:phospholipase/carboxylesterase